MEINSDIVITPPLPAATVIMLRDTAQGMEVFLLKRHGLSDVLGGAYVFPGGKVDPSDTALDMAHYLDQAPAAMHRALNEPEIDGVTASGLYVAALREAFEESGVLFAHNRSGHPLDTEESVTLLQQQRDGRTFASMLAHNALRLQTSSLLPWSRWVTPSMPSVMRKRFDTRFFVSTFPAHQIARHDDHETTESVWLPPRAALMQYWQGQIELAPPQIMSLAHLARFSTAAEVMAETSTRKPAVVRPEPHDIQGVRVLCYPGDVLHSVAEKALPGPTRLVYRNQRFEPEGGFDSLFTG